jgi:hypothetical protein
MNFFSLFLKTNPLSILFGPFSPSQNGENLAQKKTTPGWFSSKGPTNFILFFSILFCSHNNNNDLQFSIILNNEAIIVLESFIQIFWQGKHAFFRISVNFTRSLISA